MREGGREGERDFVERERARKFTERESERENFSAPLSFYSHLYYILVKM